MFDLKFWEEKIKEKSRNLSFKNFTKNILSWSNFVFYKNSGLISKFPESKRVKKVILSKKFDEEIDSLLNSGIDYSGSFFNDFQKLFSNISLPNMMHFYEYENSEFSDVVAGGKNTYLSSVIVTDCENILYSCSVKDNCRNILSSVMVWDNSENVFESSGIIKSFNIFYSNNIDNSNNIWFSSNLIGCSECILCNDLQNSSYCINNVKYDKEDYLEKKKELLSKKNLFNEFKSKVLKANNIASKNVVGQNIISSEDITYGKFVYNVKTGKNLILVGSKGDNSNEYNISSAGSPYGNNFYSGVSLSGDNLYCSCHVALSSNIFYSYFLTSCSFCIGCIGLKNKSFCILNKQYSKEEWYTLANKIFAQMDSDGILGNFFPGELNPFYFNDTMAYLIDDNFTKEEVEKEGYMRRDEKIKVDIPEVAEVVYTSSVIASETKQSDAVILSDGKKSKDPLNNNNISKQSLRDSSLRSEGQNSEKGQLLSDYQGYDSNGNWFINPEIMKKVIQDENGNIYKIVPMEYDFLMKHGLPLPEIHWLDRIKLGFKFK